MLSTATLYRIDEKDCSVQVDDRFEGDFNLAVNGHGQNRMSIDIYLPGEDEALKMDHSHSYNVDIGTIVPSQDGMGRAPKLPHGLVHLRRPHRRQQLSLSMAARAGTTQYRYSDLPLSAAGTWKTDWYST